MIRIAFWTVVAILTALLSSPAVMGHTDLVSSRPTGTLTKQPSSASLTYSADLEGALKEVTLISPAGKSTKPDPIIDGRTATIELPDVMENGRWQVEWAIVAADGHPTRDSRAFTLAVPGGAESKAPAVAAEARDASKPMDHSSFDTKPWDRLSFVGRLLFFSGLLGFIGGVLFAVWPAQGFMPRWWGWMVAATILGALSVLTAHSAIVDRRAGADFLNPLPWIEAMTSTGARGYLAAGVFTFIAWRIGKRELAPAQWRFRGGALPGMVIALTLLAASSPTFSSHATSSDGLLRVPLDIVHVAAGGVWLGGLVQLLGFTIAARNHPRLPAAVDRYSRAAMWSVLALFVTGSYAAWVELDGDLSALYSSGYGRLISAKLLLLLSTMPLARANQKRNVPALRAAAEDAIPTLRRYVLIELALVVWIILATSRLVYTAPPGSDHSSSPHGAHTSTS